MERINEQIRETAGMIRNKLKQPKYKWLAVAVLLAFFYLAGLSEYKPNPPPIRLSAADKNK